ncbi:hypothetical protein G7046_g7317 [Stylonectria norvegica]|nr:hypothetical protein G7046_g7317 [Stylonectria norvegica]
MSLEGKTALVTGSAGGLGQVIADMFLSKGANVVVCDVNRARLADAEDRYSSSHPGKVLVVEVNVSDEAAVERLVASAISKFGGLDVVVNNAGIMDHFDPAGTCDKALWDRVLAVNLTGPFLITKHALPPMQTQRRGLIINIGSNSSLRGHGAGVAYTASKHGLLGLTRNTASFYGAQGIASVALLLGGMDATHIGDAFAEGVNMEGMQMMKASHPEYVPGETGVPTEHVASVEWELATGIKRYKLGRGGLDGL